MPHGFSHDDDAGAGNQQSAAVQLGRQQAEPGIPGPLPHRPDPGEAGAAEVPDEQRPARLGGRELGEVPGADLGPSLEVALKAPSAEPGPGDPTWFATRRCIRAPSGVSALTAGSTRSSPRERSRRWLPEKPVLLENRIRAVDLGFVAASGGSDVLIDEAAQDRFSSDSLGIEVGHGDAGDVVAAARDALGDALVRPGCVVMRLVFG